MELTYNSKLFPAGFFKCNQYANTFLYGKAGNLLRKKQKRWGKKLIIKHSRKNYWKCLH